MAKRAGAFKSEKRRKELHRLKKQEEKRQRRLKKGSDGLDESVDETALPEGEDQDPGEDNETETEEVSEEPA